MSSEIITIDELEALCDASTADSLKIDVKKLADNIGWLKYPNGNYTVYLVDYENGRPKRGTAKFVRVNTRREYNRIHDLIEDTYKRVTRGGVIKENDVRNISSVVDDTNNPTGGIHTANDYERPTKAGDALADGRSVVTNGEDFGK